jgi:hypothetical protein
VILYDLVDGDLKEGVYDELRKRDAPGIKFSKGVIPELEDDKDELKNLIEGMTKYVPAQRKSLEDVITTLNEL